MHTPIPLKVTTRPVRARALQFNYYPNSDDTIELAKLIRLVLGVKISSSYDSQSGRGYHLDVDDYTSHLISQDDWIVLDSFGRPTLVPDKDFKVYYEPKVTE